MMTRIFLVPVLIINMIWGAIVGYGYVDCLLERGVGCVAKWGIHEWVGSAFIGGYHMLFVGMWVWRLSPKGGASLVVIGICYISFYYFIVSHGISLFVSVIHVALFVATCSYFAAIQRKNREQPRGQT